MDEHDPEPGGLRHQSKPAGNLKAPGTPHPRAPKGTDAYTRSSATAEGTPGERPKPDAEGSFDSGTSSGDGAKRIDPSSVPPGDGSRLQGFLKNGWTIAIGSGLLIVVIGSYLAVNPQILSSGGGHSNKQTPTPSIPTPLQGTIIVPEGARSYLAASIRARHGHFFQWQQHVEVQGYCIGEATRPQGTKAVLDERWLILATGQLIPGWTVSPDLAAGRSAGPCPRSKTIGGPQKVRLVS